MTAFTDLTRMDSIVAAARSDIIELTHHVDPRSGAIGTPRSDAVTYATKIMGEPEELAMTYDGGTGYGVYRNPAWTQLERIASRIEDGGDAVVTDSGRSAIRLFMHTLPKDSHIIVAQPDIYPGTRKMFRQMKEMTGLDVTYAVTTPESLQAALRSNTRAILTEPLTNPRMLVSDLRLVSDFAKTNGLTSIADNTVTPLVVRPLTHYDFDVVVDSLTKYVAGSNDAMAGAIIANKRRPDLAAAFRDKRSTFGGILAPGMAEKVITLSKDFPDRFGLQCKNALKIAHALAAREEISRVHFPIFNDNPGTPLAREQFAAPGALFSFELKGGVPQVEQFLNGLQGSPETVVADSFGADITMLSWYARQSMFFRNMPTEERLENGITDTFLRIAVGRSDPARVIRSLERALDNVRPVQVNVPAEVTNAHSLTR